MTKKEQNRLILEARDWEGVAEELDYQNAILFTITDALSIHDDPQIDKIRQLLERVTEDIYTVYLKCSRKEEATRAPVLALVNGGGSNG